MKSTTLVLLIAGLFAGCASAQRVPEAAGAAAGDADAMVRVADMYRRGAEGVPRDETHMVYWLRKASEADHGAASYQLYLHYLHRGLDREAVHFENRAIRQGYPLPQRIDYRRG